MPGTWIKITNDFVIEDFDWSDQNIRPSIQAEPLTLDGKILPPLWSWFPNQPYMQDTSWAFVLHADDVGIGPNGKPPGADFCTFSTCWANAYYTYISYDLEVDRVLTEEEFEALGEPLVGPTQVFDQTDYLGFRFYYEQPTYRWFYLPEPEVVKFTPQADWVSFNAVTSVYKVWEGDAYQALSGDDNVTLPTPEAAPRILDANGNRVFFLEGLTFRAGAGNDVVAGNGVGNNPIKLYGEADNDMLYGGSAADELHGGTGIDALFGGNGADQLYAGDGLSGDDGGNELFGDAGNDTLYAAASSPTANADTLDGGADRDTYYVDINLDNYDQIVDLEYGESVTGVYSSNISDKYSIYASDAYTWITFFERDGGPAAARFQFNERLLPGELSVSYGSAGFSPGLQVDYGPNNLAQFEKLRDQIAPILESIACTVAEAALTFVTDAVSKRAAKAAAPAILDQVLKSDAATNALVSALENFQSVFGALTANQFEDAIDDLLGKMLQPLTSLVMKKIEAEDCNAQFENEALDWALLLTTPLQIVSPAVNFAAQVGPYIHISILGAIDLHFAAQEAELLNSLPDVMDGVINGVIEVDGNEIRIIDDTDDLPDDAGGNGTDDSVYTSVSLESLPGQVENAYLQEVGATQVDGTISINGTVSALATVAPTGLFVKANSLNNTLVGNKDSNLLVGRDGNDWLVGVEGGDRLEGGAGNDTLSGGADDDRLIGGEGNDTLIGEDGNDVLIDRSLDANTFDGGAGEDRVVSGGGTDVVSGGEDRDVIKTAGGDDSIDGGAGNDVILSGTENDTAFGGAGDDVIKTSLGDDYVEGGDGNDIIFTWRGEDTAIGGAGDDTIRGDFDDDIIEGGSGNDRLIGAPGRDTFIFRNGFEEDRILDFTNGSDLMDFTNHTGVSGIGDLSISQVSTNVVITDGSGGRIVLADTDILDIDAGDFVFVV